MAELTINADEIAAALRKHVGTFSPTLAKDQVGRILEVGDGIARVSGLPDTAVNELLEFEGGLLGLALNLDEESIGAVVLGHSDKIEEGGTAKNTGRILSVPVGDGLIVRVINALGGAIDDATGTVLALHFRPAEDLHGYLTLLRRIADAYGLPVSLYGDRLGVFVRNDEHWTLAEELQGIQDPTHFGQVLADLGIGYIAAHSPQAKGRVERLWETLQDRLVVALRLHDIHTVAAAEAFLPTYLADHNRRMTQPPADAKAAWRRAPRDLADRLSCRYTRVVARDNTVRLGTRLVQIPRGPHGRSYARCRVELRECLDGRLLVTAQGRRLVTDPAPAADFVLVPRRAQRLRASQRASDEGGRALPLQQNGPSSAIAALTALAQHLRRPARPHPWRQTFSRRQRERRRQETLTT